MGRNRFPEAKSYTPVMQAFFVCNRYEGFSYKISGMNSVAITGKLHPSSLHLVYEIEIKYILGKYPLVKILSPEIRSDSPHTFNDNSICTFYPDSLIWNRKMKISESIIPWVCDWIFHYEIWLVTGKWNGDADHRHPRRKQNAS